MSRRLLIKRISIAVFLFASCNLAWEIYDEVLRSLERERIARETGWVICTFGPPRDLLARFHIELFLILVLIGNRLKSLPRTLLNVVGLTGAVISYILWWQYLLQAVRNAHTTVAAARVHHFAYLLDGNILDPGIAAAIGLLVILNVRDAALSFVSVDDQ